MFASSFSPTLADCVRFILATESYGARFGPVFTQYFHSQNDKIDSGDVDGEKIVVSKLLINKYVPFPRR